MLSDSELGVIPGSSTVKMNYTFPQGRGGLHSGEHLVVDTKTPFLELRGAILDVGIFRDTLLPSLGVHTGLSLIAYGIGRSTNKVEVKDWLWPSAQVFNAWWSAVGRRVLLQGIPLSSALSQLSRPERLLLTGVTLWGGRQFYHIARRSLSRRDVRGKHQDDPRYDAMKKESGFWDNALLTQFLPEALFQTVITLPFVAPFRHQGGVFTGYHPVVQAVAVGLFSTGFALQAIGDFQLAQFKKKVSAEELTTEGVWSIVRHPNYLGDALIHFSFPLLLYSSDMLAPIELLGPVANYVYIRYISGVQQLEESQAERYEGNKKLSLINYQNRPEINSFWPALAQVNNQWTWIVLGAGATGAVIENIFHALHLE